jgi:hypothetical protein
MESRLYERIEAKLKDKWLAKDVVEKEIALKAATTLSDWLKITAIPVGLAAAMMIATLSYFGIKSTTDLAAAEKQASNLKETADNLAVQYQPLQNDLPRLQQIVTKVTNLETRVNGIETQVARFATSSNLTPETAKTLESTLSRYSKYLVNLGLQPPITPTVHVEDNIASKGCYHGCEIGQNIYLLTGYATPALVVHEFTHTVIMKATSGGDGQWQYSAIEAGVANYLTADFLNSPIIDEVNLNGGSAFDAIPHTWAGGQGEGGMAWGAYLWKLRAQAGANKNRVTKAVVQAWTSVKSTSPPHDYQAEFLQALVTAGLDPSQLKNTFASAPN